MTNIIKTSLFFIDNFDIANNIKEAICSTNKLRTYIDLNKLLFYDNEIKRHFQWNIPCWVEGNNEVMFELNWKRPEIIISLMSKAFSNTLFEAYIWEESTPYMATTNYILNDKLIYRIIHDDESDPQYIKNGDTIFDLDEIIIQNPDDLNNSDYTKYLVKIGSQSHNQTNVLKVLHPPDKTQLMAKLDLNDFLFYSIKHSYEEGVLEYIQKSQQYKEVVLYFALKNKWQKIIDYVMNHTDINKELKEEFNNHLYPIDPPNRYDISDFKDWDK